MLQVKSRSAYWAILLMAPGGLSACGGQRGSAAAPADTKPGKVASAGLTQGGRVPEAEARLAAFLEGSLESSPPTETNLLMACVPNGQTDRYTTLARYRVLNSALRGDSVDASAEVVTVAVEVGDPHAANKYVTTVRTHVDTLHWVMAHDTAGDTWGVCGYSKEGLGFGHYGNDRDTRWNPPNWSWARVRQTAESLRAQR